MAGPALTRAGELPLEGQGAWRGWPTWLPGAGLIQAEALPEGKVPLS